MLPSMTRLAASSVPIAPSPAPVGVVTVAQRINHLAIDDEQRAAWKSGLKWAKDRASDHVVHVRDDNGRERERRLFEDYDPSKAKTYDDHTLRGMLDWFVLAEEQYRTFL